MSPSLLVYKIARRGEWRDAVARRCYAGSPDDRRDGFVHLSAGHQLAGTLARHFRAEKDLLLVAYRAGDLGSALKWEASRGGDLFPHHHGPLDPGLALWVRPIAEDGCGHRLPPLEEEG